MKKSKRSNIPINRSELPNIFVYYYRLIRLWRTRNLTNNGYYHERLASSLEDYLDIDNITLFANGHLALEYAIESLDKKGEVITTPFTFVSTTQSIIRTGNIPVFCDINKTDLTIDVNLIEKLITNKTIAIVPVHVFGNICDVYKLKEISLKHSVPIIYDAAHAFGSRINDTPISNFGNIVMYSFHATKVFHTIEGGALAYIDSNLRHRFDAMKNFGIDLQSNIFISGGNAKMNDLQASMGIENLKRVDRDIKKRKKLWDLYLSELNNINEISLPKSKSNIDHNASYFVILVKQGHDIRESLIDYLEFSGVLTRKYFSPLTYNIAYLKEIDFSYLEVANEVVNQVLSLPMYTSLSVRKVKYISKKIKEFFNK